MLKSVKVTNYLGEELLMELSSPEKSGFNIYDIEGIGPGKAFVNTTEIPTTDGSKFNSARSPERNIVIKLKFMDNFDIESLRHLSYKLFPLQKELKLEIESDKRTVEITGIVDANEPTIFEKSTGTYISIICPKTWFYLSGPNGIQTTVFYGVDPAFEFPFSNESLTENLLEMGTINMVTEANINYIGDIEVGMTIIINAFGAASGLSIHNVRLNTAMYIDSVKLKALVGSDIQAGDEIIINTVKGEKEIWLLRNGVYNNILNAVTRGADWFQLAKGDNLMAYAAVDGLEQLEFRILNRILLEGA